VNRWENGKGESSLLAMLGIEELKEKLQQSRSSERKIGNE